MDPKIVKKPAFTVVGLKCRGKNEHGEIPQLWGTFMSREGELQQIRDKSVCYGVMDNYDEASGDFDYVAAFEVEPAAGVPEGMVRWEVPAAKYAVVPCTLPTITQAFDQVYKAWLPASGYKRAPTPDFEVYDEQFDPNDPSSPMYIYIPIE
jgi:predicted transcriptional regulator YdeE